MKVVGKYQIRRGLTEVFRSDAGACTMVGDMVGEAPRNGRGAFGALRVLCSKNVEGVHVLDPQLLL